jgi:hypothetical protein
VIYRQNGIGGIEAGVTGKPGRTPLSGAEKIALTTKVRIYFHLRFEAT